MRRLASFGLGVIGSSLLLVHCVGDSPLLGLPDASTDASSVPDSMVDSTPTDAVDETRNSGCDAAFESDPRACGRCGHDCLSGGCQTGQCQSWTFDNGLSPYARGPAVDGTKVLWGGGDNKGAAPAQVFACERTGCGNDASTLANAPGLGIVNRVAVEGANLFFETNDPADAAAIGFNWCPRSGCVGSPLQRFAGQLQFLVSDGTALYFGSNNTAYVCTGDCSAPTVFLANGAVRDVAFDATNPKDIYFVSGNDMWAADRTNVATRRKLLVTPYGSVSNDAQRVAAGGGLVYAAYGVSEGSVTIISCPANAVQSCSPTVVATGLDLVRGIVADATNVYFTDYGTATKLYQDGFLGYCPKTGCSGGKPRVLVSKVTQAGDLAQDGQALYTTTVDSPGVLAVAKP